MTSRPSTPSTAVAVLSTLSTLLPGLIVVVNMSKMCLDGGEMFLRQNLKLDMESVAPDAAVSLIFLVRSMAIFGIGIGLLSLHIALKLPVAQRVIPHICVGLVFVISDISHFQISRGGLGTAIADYEPIQDLTSLGKRVHTVFAVVNILSSVVVQLMVVGKANNKEKSA
mmetsp:Transcript_6643/g.10966  ORF Transcript_6643/g.10966 Transcript_6643/m.10966 type:complete len:169 (-) Transcript_6643:188-694(-)|eukprot:CAMPEP_0119010180 /NCGR_PEP_ID=MMETSP1176-20130426/4848_1 /TAXON_ID=265551 /ORGANISM="Synedropsis recta cf, Strain CCMP1620" /LENGTH=168 /DNA_ID=CAMNT_0006962807 /DNA_START=38 /DNA_END=544 /DNA_ORIENTATION=-